VADGAQRAKVSERLRLAAKERRLSILRRGWAGMASRQGGFAVTHPELVGFMRRARRGEKAPFSILIAAGGAAIAQERQAAFGLFDRFGLRWPYPAGCFAPARSSRRIAAKRIKKRAADEGRAG